MRPQALWDTPMRKGSFEQSAPMGQQPEDNVTRLSRRVLLMPYGVSRAMPDPSSLKPGATVRRLTPEVLEVARSPRNYARGKGRPLWRGRCSPQRRACFDGRPCHDDDGVLVHHGAAPSIRN